MSCIIIIIIIIEQNIWKGPCPNGSDATIWSNIALSYVYLGPIRVFCLGTYDMMMMNDDMAWNKIVFESFVPSNKSEMRFWYSLIWSPAHS